MKIILAFFAFTLALVTAEDAIKVDPSKEGDKGIVDLSGTDLTNQFCELANKRCTQGSVLESKPAPTARQCVTRCARNLKCLSAHLSKDKKCTLMSGQCTVSQLVADNGGVNLHRLKQGAQCTADRPEFVPTKVKYANSFCMAWGKKCPGRDLYPKPQNVAPYMECLKKCARISSCGMVDVFDDKCSPKEYACDEKDLIEDKSYRNFLRLKEGETTCTGGRTEPSDKEPPTPVKPVKPDVIPIPPPPKYCDRELFNCWFHDIQTILFVFSRYQCKEYCNANSRCKSIHHTITGICYLKDYACTNDQLKPSFGHDAVKLGPGETCEKYEPSYKYCRKPGKNCMFHDIKIYLAVGTLDRCEYYCNYQRSCESLYWDNILKICYLKNYKCSGWRLLWALGHYSERC